MQPQNKDSLVVYKENRLNHAVFQNFGLNCYQVLMHLISKIKGYENFQSHTEEIEAFSLSAVEFKEVFNVSNKICYSILKRSVDKLLKTQITLNLDDRIRKINICSSADYVKNNGKIEVRFTKEILPLLIDVQTNFLTYKLKEIANFKSLHTTRLYELLQQFKNTGWFEISVEELKRVLAVEKKFQSYFYFKKRTFAQACGEINEIHKINLRFSEIKEGRKVVKIRFDFDTIVTQTLQENTIKQTSLPKEEMFISDEKLVQVPFAQISSVIDNTTTNKSIKQKKPKIDTFPIKTAQEEKEKVKESTKQKKSIWQSISSFFSKKN